MYLLDTNIWLERMLEQARSEEVERLLAQVASDQLLITDFSLHSVGVILSRLNRRDEFLSFVQDLFVDGAVGLVSLEPADMERLVAVMSRFGLDFDDAYQYVAAERYDVEIVSFDSDFDGTQRGRVTPAEIVVAE
jgi:predicted nucleic acid-binding protein